MFKKQKSYSVKGLYSTCVSASVYKPVKHIILQLVHKLFKVSIRHLVLYLSCIVDICRPEEGATGHKSVPEPLWRSDEIKRRHLVHMIKWCYHFKSNHKPNSYSVLFVPNFFFVAVSTKTYLKCSSMHQKMYGFYRIFAQLSTVSPVLTVSVSVFI